MEKNSMPRFYTINEVAESLRMTRQTISQMCSRGELDAVRIGTGRRGVIRITAESFDRLVNSYKEEK